MSYKYSKFNQEKIEKIMRDNKLNFESNDNGYYYIEIKLYGKQKGLEIIVNKTNISFRKSGYNSISVSSYKIFEKLIKDYYLQVDKELWSSLSREDKLMYLAIEEYQESGTTKLVENIVNASINNINNTHQKMRSLKHY